MVVDPAPQPPMVVVFPIRHETQVAEQIKSVMETGHVFVKRVIHYLTDLACNVRRDIIKTPLGMRHVQDVVLENTVRLELPLAQTVQRGHIAEQGHPLARTVRQENIVRLGLPLVRIVMRAPDATVLERRFMQTDRAHVFNVQTIHIVDPRNVQNQI